VAEHSARKSGWRGYLATWVWPWAVVAWLIPYLLLRLVHLIPILNQDWLRWFLVAVEAIAPVVTWWVRGRGREPAVGFFALFWLLATIGGAMEVKGITIPDYILELSVLLLVVIYWPSWAWFYKLRKLPSARIGEADKLSISIFLLTGTPGIAASVGGPDAVKQWQLLVVAFFVTLFLTVGLVVLGMKGPALMQEDLKDMLPWAVPWARFYAEPSVIVAVSFGAITFVFTLQSVAPPRWLVPVLGVGYLFVVVLLQWVLVRPSQGRTPLGQITKDSPASTPQSARPEGGPADARTHRSI
jgi:hypothetical protein